MWLNFTHFLHILCGIHSHRRVRCTGCWRDTSCCANSLPPHTAGRPSRPQTLGDCHKDPRGRNPRGRGQYRKGPSRSPGISCTAVRLGSNLLLISVDCISSRIGSFRNPLDERLVVSDCTYLEQYWSRWLWGLSKILLALIKKCEKSKLSFYLTSNDLFNIIHSVSKRLGI